MTVISVIIVEPLQVGGFIFKNVVEDLVKHSNRHNDCSKSIQPCLRKGRCKAQFPRDIVETTMVDPATGAIKNE